MISICIPIYNFNVSQLVNTLSRQSKLLDCPSEIILIDDGSDPYFKKANSTCCSKEIYIQLDKNIGRAAIRNRFLNYAKYGHLLFLDCDMVIPSSEFLFQYIEAIKAHPDQLICGGKKYLDSPPKERSKMLRWKYGVKRECKPYEIRNQNPNKSFITSNFVIAKSIFELVQFDERLTEYGHEDTLFGYELKKRNINILHIDNPVLSVDLVNNTDYISNTEKAITNLIHILEFTNRDKGFIEDVTLLKTYYKWYGLRKITAILFVMTQPVIKYALVHGYVNLYLFDFYKLGTLTLKMNKKLRQVITLNEVTFEEKCNELFSKLEIQPDLVFGILNGGGFLLHEIKKQKKFGSVPLIPLHVQRRNQLKDHFFVRFILRNLPYKLLNLFRIYESKKARKSIKTLDLNELLDYQIDFDSSAIPKESIKTILIIDDAIDTGRTMFIVKNNLKACIPTAQIKTAVMSWTIETSIEKPDYYLYKNVLVRYPWSRDYKHKHEK